MLAGRIRELAPQVARDGGWPKKQLAAAVNETPTSGTLNRALALLYATEEWESIGATRAIRIGPLGTNWEGAQTALDSEEPADPAIHAIHANPLGEGTFGTNQDNDESDLPWAQTSAAERERRLQRLRAEGA